MRSKINVELLHATPLYIASTAIRTCRNNHHLSDSVAKAKDGDVIHHNYPECLSVVDAEFDTMEIGESDTSLIDRIANKNHHKSTVEHISFNFYISNLPRNTLLELSRHRIASYTVKSSRYTLKELKKVNSFLSEDPKCANDPDYELLVETEREKSYSSALINIVNKIKTVLTSKTYINFLDRRMPVPTYMNVKEASKYLYLIDEPKVDSASVRALENLREIIVTGMSIDKAKFSMPENYLTELTFTINASSLKNLLELRTAKGALFTIRELSNAIIEAVPEEYQFIIRDIDNGNDTKDYEDGRNA